MADLKTSFAPWDRRNDCDLWRNIGREYLDGTRAAVRLGGMRHLIPVPGTIGGVGDLPRRGSRSRRPSLVRSVPGSRVVELSVAQGLESFGRLPGVVTRDVSVAGVRCRPGGAALGVDAGLGDERGDVEAL